MTTTRRRRRSLTRGVAVRFVSGTTEDDMDEMKVNVYVRVSTTGQDEGNSLDTQASACVKLAQEHGSTAHSADVMGETASGTDEPPAAQQATSDGC